MQKRKKKLGGESRSRYSPDCRQEPVLYCVCPDQRDASPQTWVGWAPRKAMLTGKATAKRNRPRRGKAQHKRLRGAYLQLEDHVQHPIRAVGFQQLDDVGMFQHVTDAGFSLEI